MAGNCRVCNPECDRHFDAGICYSCAREIVAAYYNGAQVDLKSLRMYT